MLLLDSMLCTIHAIMKPTFWLCAKTARRVFHPDGNAHVWWGQIQRRICGVNLKRLSVCLFLYLSSRPTTVNVCKHQLFRLCLRSVGMAARWTAASDGKDDILVFGVKPESAATVDRFSQTDTDIYLLNFETQARWV